MRCPFCGHEDTQVKDSRPSEDNSAFYETQLARVDFSRSNKLETVGAYAFFGATSLERVNFGVTVKETGVEIYDVVGACGTVGSFVGLFGFASVH